MDYPTPYKVVLETAYFRLLCMKESNEHPSALLLGAIAGHKTQFSIDFREGKSVAGSAVKHNPGGVYVLDIKPPSLLSRFTVTYRTWLSWVKKSIEFIDTGPVRLVGICQGGAMASLFATRNPELVSELIIAASPIDTSTPSVITPAQQIWYCVYVGVVRAHGWIMPGKVMLKAWMDHNPEMHKEKMKDPKNAYFYARYHEVQDIDPYAYLDTIKGWFLTQTYFNELHITCPVQIVVGEKDDITPPIQTRAIQTKCTEDVIEHLVSGGHMDTFGGSKPMKDGGAWHTIFAGL